MPQGQDLIGLFCLLPVGYQCIIVLFSFFSGLLYKSSTDFLIQAVQNILLFFLFSYLFNEFSIYFKLKEYYYERYYSNLVFYSF